MYLSLSFLDSLKGFVMFLFKLSELCFDLSPLSLSFFTVLLNCPQVLVLVSVDHSPELIPILSKLLNSDLLAFDDFLGFEALLLTLLELVLLDTHV